MTGSNTPERVDPPSKPPEPPTGSGKFFDLSVLDSEAMYRRIGKAFFAQRVEKTGVAGARPPEHYINIVRDVAVAIKLYLEDTQ